MNRAHRNNTADLPGIASEIIRYANRDAHARHAAPDVGFAAYVNLTRPEVSLHVYGFSITDPTSGNWPPWCTRCTPPPDASASAVAPSCAPVGSAS